MSSSRLALVRARVSLPEVRRALGLLAGRHRSVLTGHGTDFDDLRVYEPGDDVSDIDWKSTARAGEPVIRRFRHEIALRLILLVDTGRAMAATAAGGEPKSTVANLVAASVAYLAQAGGDRVALLAGDAERMVRRPARASSSALEATLTALDAMWSVEAPASNLGHLLGQVLRTVTRRSLVVVLTDESNPRPEHDRLLKLLAVQHEVMWVSIADLAVLDRDVVGNEAITDIDTRWRIPEFLRGDDELAEEAAAARAERRDAAAAMLARRRVPLLRVGSTDEVVPGLVDLLGRLKHVGR